MMNDDMDLVRDYAIGQSEQAFASIVSRHINLVYSTALRQVGDENLAEEVTQAVFIILARKAASLGAGTILPGWLYRTACYAAKDALRTQRRRQHHEQEAYMHSTLDAPQTDSTWEQLSPLLDDAMTKLRQDDRDALVLRFFERKSLQEVGVAFGTSEDAAKKRVSRALEKLRRAFAQRGVNSTTAIIGEKISARSIQAAPAALAKVVTAVAVAKGAAASVSTLTLVKGALKIMAWTKTKTAVVAGAAVLLVAGTATLPAIHRAALERKITWKMDVQALENEPPVVLIRPAAPMPGVEGGGWSLGGTESTHGKLIGMKNSVLRILMLAYRNSKTESVHPDRVIYSTELPEGEYDFIACTPTFQKEGLQRALKDKFNLSAHWESRETNVFLLRLRNAGAPGIKINETSHGGASEEGQGRFSIQCGSPSLLADYLEDSSLVGVPVIDRTELTNSYDIDLTWPTKGRNWTLPIRAELDRILLDQLGLELVPARENVKFLVVEKAK
jgi:uncharacterized protein (TIGR03435 family)